MIKQIFSYKIAVLTFLFLVACQPKESLLIGDTTCSPPCWRGITPGVTSDWEALEILATISEVEWQPIPTLVTADNKQNYVGRLFKDGYKERNFSIHFHNGIVSALEFGFGGNVRFEEMIQYLGEPEQISVFSGWGDAQYLHVTLLYPQQGYSITYFEIRSLSNGFVEIHPKMRITRVIYFEPSLYEELLDRMLIRSFSIEFIKEYITDWRGYGSYPYIDVN